MILLCDQYVGGNRACVAQKLRNSWPGVEKAPSRERGLGILWALALIFAGAGLGCGPEGPLRPHLVLVTLDTTRADHLGAYGYDPPTSPHFDALALEAHRYTAAYSTSSWTLPAHASLFTGQFPTTHGAQYAADGALALDRAIEAPAGVRARSLPDATPTLAGLLGRAGYHSAGFVAGPWLLRSFGLARGFDHWDDSGILDHGGRPAADVTGAAIEWLRTRPEGPFLLFLNYFDPHFPYEPGPDDARRFLPPGTDPDPTRREQWGALYDAEIRSMDASLGELLAFLREADLYDDTLIVVTSDHGELLGEHEEWGHGRLLYEELVRVPLLVKPAEAAPIARVIERRTQPVDVFRWLLEAAGVAPPPETAGPEHPVLAEVHSLSPKDPRRTRVAWLGDQKLHVREGAEPLLFDIRRDPRERVDRFSDDPARSRALVAELAAAFGALPARDPQGSVPEVDPATLEALEELGYLE
jgi:arylsulfatase A-like enzyme